MAKITELTNAVFDSINTATNIYNKHLEEEANLSTKTKSIQLQNDVNDELARIRNSSDFGNWNQEVNNFYTRLKSEMSNKDSKYYCRNNLQADQFSLVLEQSRANTIDQVQTMAEKEALSGYRIEIDKGIQNMKALGLSGQALYDEAVKLIDDGRSIGAYTQEEVEKKKAIAFYDSYNTMYDFFFDYTIDESIERGDSFEKIWNMMQEAGKENMNTDITNLPLGFDKKVVDTQNKKKYQQMYNAKIADIQQANADTLSQVVQDMRQQTTAEGKVSVARRGQMEMNKMKGKQLSESDRLQYSSIFEIGLNGNVKGSGSGSGSKKPGDSFEKYLKAAPDRAIQLAIDNPDLCPYDVSELISNDIIKDWMQKDWDENYDKDYQERIETFGDLYQSKASKESITNVMLDKLVDKYPTAANYLKNNCTNLIKDIQKNPKQYGEASVGELADFMRDWVLSAPANATDEDFQTALKQHVDNCYIERCKYIELKDNGNLRDTFNAKKPADIAKAAQLVSEKDFVFTDTQGNERWAKGKKEALEAPGGVVNVLQNAVVGTLGIPESEYKDLSFYYQRDESGHDMTNKPIITYKDKAYEVIANDDGKGFTVREYAVDENGKMQKVRDIEGKAGGKLQQVMRKGEKTEAATDVKNAGINVATLKKNREQAINKAITESTSIPKAMKAVGTIEKEEWENVKTVENRTTYLNITERKINNDASKVEKDKMSAAEFKNKYGIDYNEWIKTGERSAHYELILKS